MWIKLDALNNHEFIIAKASSGATTDAFHLRTEFSDLDFTYVNTDTTTYTVRTSTATRITINTWSHIVFGINSTNQFIYVDGVFSQEYSKSKCSWS